MPDIERKTVELTELKAIGDGSGGFSGYGSIFGNVDSYGDVVMPGAFAETLPTFLQSGFVGASHDWDEPVAIPTAANEDARGLFIEATFHSDGKSQDVRTRMAERSALGKSIGLSIGYQTKRYEMIAVDAALEQGIAKQGDPEHWMGGYRLLKQLDLYEVSVVTVPANTAAVVTGIKAPERMSFTEHVEFAEGLVSGLKAFADRVRSRTDVRVKEGRVLSEANRTRISAHVDSLRGVADDIEALLAAAEPTTGKGVLALHVEYEQTRARLRGLGIAS